MNNPNPHEVINTNNSNDGFSIFSSCINPGLAFGNITKIVDKVRDNTSTIVNGAFV
jgi:hypothetical protein